MTLQERIYKDLQDVSLKLNEKATLKVIKSEIQKEKFKEVPDKRVISIIKSYVKGCEEMLVYLDKIVDSKHYNSNMNAIKFLSRYLPKQATITEIKTWIKDNVNFSQYKNKMQAMKPIMNHFGSNADGRIVKSILMGM
jgi:uncharacterized protein YqeY